MNSVGSVCLGVWQWLGRPVPDWVWYVVAMLMAVGLVLSLTVDPQPPPLWFLVGTAVACLLTAGQPRLNKWLDKWSREVQKKRAMESQAAMTQLVTTNMTPSPDVTCRKSTDA